MRSSTNIEPINEYAKRYQDALAQRLANDPDFRNSEIIQDGWQVITMQMLIDAGATLLSKGKAKMPSMNGKYGKIAIGAGSALAGAASRTGLTAYPVSKDINSAKRAELAAKLEQHIQAVLPVEINSAANQELLGRLQFLNTVSYQEINNNRSEFIDNYRHQVEIVLHTRNHQESSAALEELKVNYETHKILTAHLIAQQNNLAESQQAFAKALQEKTDSSEDIAAITSQLAGLGINVNKQLEKLLKSNKGVREQIDDISRYVNRKEKEDVAVRNEQDRVAELKAISDCAGFIGQLGQFTRSKELCQLATVVQAGVQIKNATHLLKAANAAGDIASLASLANCANIAGAVLAVVSMFGKNGPNPHEMMMQQLREMAQQIHELRKEMHERFDQLEDQLAKHHQVMLQKFVEIRFDNVDIKNTLNVLFSEIQGNHQETQHVLTTLCNKIQSLAANHAKVERFKSLKEMVDIAERVNGTHRIDDKEFVVLFNQLMANFKLTHSANMNLVGSATATEAEVVSNFESEHANPYVASFNISSLMKYFSDLSSETNQVQAFNPVMFAYQAIIFMELIKRKYKTEDLKSFDDRISEAELADLNKVALLADGIHQYFSSLCNGVIITKAASEFVAQGNVLHTALTQFIQNQESRLSSQLVRELLTRVQSYQATTLDSFTEQNVPMQLNHKGWYEGTRVDAQYHSHKQLNKAGSSGCSSNKYAYSKKAGDQEIWDDSLSSLKSSIINAIRSEITRLTDASLAISDVPYQLAQHRNFAAKTQYYFIFPEAAEQPILPLWLNGKVMNLHIPNEFKNAEFEGLGMVRLKYRIEAEHFIISADFVGQNATVQPIKIIRLPYQPGIYTGSEAIWRYFIGGPQHFKELTEINSYSSPAIHDGGKDWRNEQYYSNVPTFVERTGDISKLARNEHGELIDPSVREEILYTGAILQSLRTQSNEFKLQKIRALHDVFIRDEQSPVTKALIRYSHRYYMMRSWLDLLYSDSEEVAQDQALSYFKNGMQSFSVVRFIQMPTFRHRADLKNLLDKPELLRGYSLLDVLSFNIRHFNEDIGQRLRSLADHSTFELDNTIVENLPHIIHTLKRKYEQVGAVTENALVTRRSETELMQRQNQLLSSVMTAAGGALLNLLTPAQLKQFANDTAERLGAMEGGYEADGDSILHLLVRRPQIAATAEGATSAAYAANPQAFFSGHLTRRESSVSDEVTPSSPRMS